MPLRPLLDLPFRKVLSERGGNVAVIFALASIPLLGFTGVAIDYGFATKLATKLQAGTDATALTLCQTPSTTTASQLQSKAQTMLTGYMGTTSGLVIDPLVITSNPRKVLLTARATHPAYFGKFTGSATLTVGAKAQCATPLPKDFEIALVLDNTGSMGDAGDDGVTKLSALQSAAKSFVTSVYNNPAFGPNTKISIVPFASSVALNPTTYSTASWVDTLGLSTYHWWNVTAPTTSLFVSRLSIFAKLKAAKSSFGWAGCFQSLPYPQNVTDTGVTIGNANTLYVPHFAPDEPGNGGAASANGYYNNGNSYINDSTSALDCPAISGSSSSNYMKAEARACKYVSPQNPQSSLYSNLGYTGPNFGCTTQPLQTLTNDTTTLHNLIDSMQALGTTNIHEGFMWGWRTISPNSVLGGNYSPTPSNVPAAYTDDKVEKIIILMTDGSNTWLANSSSPNKSLFSSFGYFINSANSNNADALFPSANKNIDSAADARNGIDALTATACTNAKASPAGITIFTIGFSTTDSPIDSAGQTLLTNCAGGPNGNPIGGKYIPAKDSTSLNSAFAQIAASIGALRLTQ